MSVILISVIITAVSSLAVVKASSAVYAESLLSLLPDHIPFSAIFKQDYPLQKTLLPSLFLLVTLFHSCYLTKFLHTQPALTLPNTFVRL